MARLAQLPAAAYATRQSIRHRERQQQRLDHRGGGGGLARRQQGDGESVVYIGGVRGKPDRERA